MMKKANWSGKGKGTGFGNKLLLIIVSLFGPIPAYLMSHFVIIFYMLTDKEGKTAISDFYSKLYDKRPPFFRIYSNYYSFGVSLIDRVLFLIRSNTFFRYNFINEELIELSLKNGKGAILLSAHIGNWDIAGNLLKNRLNTPINAVMIDNEKKEIKEALKNADKKRSFKIIPLKFDSPETMIAIRKALSSNELVCLHGDRTFENKGLSMNFLNHKAVFPEGAFQIAALTGTPIIPVFITKKEFNQYEFKAFEAIEFKNVTRENRDNAIKQGLEKFVGILEEIVKEKPDQWFNFYKFWQN